MADPRETARQWLADTMCADLDGDREEPCFRCVEKADAIVNRPGVEVTTLSGSSADYHGDMLVFGERIETRPAILLPPEPAEVLKTPDKWQAEMPDLVVVDPDGWRGDGGRPWTDPISREEYIARRNLCTVLDAARQRGDGNRPGA